MSEFTIRRTPRYDCSRLVAEADVTENEVDTGEDDDGDVMYMSGSHPAVDYESVQYDVDLGGDSEDDGVRESLPKVPHVFYVPSDYESFSTGNGITIDSGPITIHT